MTRCFPCCRNRYDVYEPQPEYRGPALCQIFLETLGKVIVVALRAIAELVTLPFVLLAIPIAYCCKKWVIKGDLFRFLPVLLPGLNNTSYIAHPVYFSREDGVQLEGVYEKGTKQPEVIVICCGGNAQTAQRRESYQFLKDAGFSIFCYNRKGVEKSGTFGKEKKEEVRDYPSSQEEMRKDGEAALKHVVDTYKPHQGHLFGYGHSMGGFEILSIGAAAKNQGIEMSIVPDATFSSLPDVPHAYFDDHIAYNTISSKITPYYSLKFFTSTVLRLIGFHGASNKELIKEIGPERCFIINRKADEIIPERARPSEPNSTLFLSHNDGLVDSAQKEIIKFFQGKIPPPPPPAAAS